MAQVAQVLYEDMDILIVIDHRYLWNCRLGRSQRFGSFRQAPGISLPMDDTIGGVAFAERHGLNQRRAHIGHYPEAHPSKPVPQGAVGSALDHSLAGFESFL